MDLILFQLEPNTNPSPDLLIGVWPVHISIIKIKTAQRVLEIERLMW